MSILAGKNIFVTGGTGSFGRAFVRRALDAGASRIVVYSRDELKQAQLAAEVSDDRLRCLIGDVRDLERLRLAVRGCDTVIHAAAMKRIEKCEEDPTEAVATNIFGTRCLALAAIDAGVERAVFLSTDKAPAANTLYGMTKAVAERLWVQSNVFAAGRTPCTKLSATRYGNVLGSRGSVLDLWRDQFHREAPLTLTDERATRFWMTIDQAVELVCFALTHMQGGEIFVPKVPSSSILDLARAVAEGRVLNLGTGEYEPQAYEPGHECTGLRPGERLHETLISQDEARQVRDVGTHYVIDPAAPSWRGKPGLIESLRRKPEINRVGHDFSYRSDTNPDRASVDDLRRMIA